MFLLDYALLTISAIHVMKFRLQNSWPTSKLAQMDVLHYLPVINYQLILKLSLTIIVYLNQLQLNANRDVLEMNQNELLIQIYVMLKLSKNVKEGALWK